MKKFTLLLLGLFAVGAYAADAANDVVLSQRNAGNTGFVQRNVTAVANSPIGFDASSVPVVLTAFTHNLTTGAVEVTAGGTNQNVTITPSGTGVTRVADAAGGNNYVEVSPASTTAKIFSRQQGSGASFISESYSDTVSAGIVGRRYKNTILSPGAVVDGDTLVFMGGAGYDSSAITTSRASVSLLAAGTWTTISNPTRINFSTTPSASTSNTVRWSIDQTGALTAPSTNTAGLQLYNTSDQTTNYERLEALWSSNAANIRTVAAGTGVVRDMTFTVGNNQYNLSNTAVAGPFHRMTVGPSSVAGRIGLLVATTGWTQTGGTQAFLSLTPTYNQASGTASNTDFLVNRTPTAIGSGLQKLADLQSASATKFTVLQGGLQGIAATSTATAAATTTLTALSSTYQVFTGSTTQTIQLPAANVLGSGVGAKFIIKNRSSGSLTVNRAGSDTIDGLTSDTILAGASMTYISDGTSDWGKN